MTRRIKKKPEEELDALVDSVLDPRTPPIANVKPGETLEVETWSALARVINPTTGPLYIEGAEPGDTLVVDIINIELPSQGIVGIIPGFGAMEGWLNLMEPKRKICKIENNTITYMGPGLNVGGPLRGGKLLNVALHIIGEPRDEGVHWHVIGGGHINITFLMHSIWWGTDIYI